MFPFREIKLTAGKTDMFCSGDVQKVVLFSLSKAGENSDLKRSYSRVCKLQIELINKLCFRCRSNFFKTRALAQRKIGTRFVFSQTLTNVKLLLLFIDLKILVSRQFFA